MPSAVGAFDAAALPGVVANLGRSVSSCRVVSSAAADGSWRNYCKYCRGSAAALADAGRDHGHECCADIVAASARIAAAYQPLDPMLPSPSACDP